MYVIHENHAYMHRLFLNDLKFSDIPEQDEFDTRTVIFLYFVIEWDRNERNKDKAVSFLVFSLNQSIIPFPISIYKKIKISWCPETKDFDSLPFSSLSKIYRRKNNFSFGLN